MGPSSESIGELGCSPHDCLVIVIHSGRWSRTSPGVPLIAHRRYVWNGEPEQKFAGISRHEGTLPGGYA